MVRMWVGEIRRVLQKVDGGFKKCVGLIDGF